MKLWYIICVVFSVGECFCENLVHRFKDDSNVVTNIFPNTHNLCNRGYCESRNALCNDYSCCHCKCRLGKCFFSQNSGCLTSTEIKSEIQKKMKALSKDTFTMIFLGTNLKNIIMLSSSDDFNKMKIPLKSLAAERFKDIISCNGSSIYYISDSNVDSILLYDNNQCESVLGVHKNGDFLNLKWNSDLRTQWGSLNGRLIVFEITCLVQTSRKPIRKNALMAFQLSGQHETGSKLPEAVKELDRDCNGMKKNFSPLNFTVMDKAPESDEDIEEKSNALLFGVIIGLVIVVILTIIVVIMVCYLVKKNLWNTKRLATINQNRNSKAGNCYAVPSPPPKPLHDTVTEDTDGYLLPKEWIGVTPRDSLQPIRTTITAIEDNDGYLLPQECGAAGSHPKTTTETSLTFQSKSPATDITTTTTTTKDSQLSRTPLVNADSKPKNPVTATLLKATKGKTTDYIDEDGYVSLQHFHS